MSKVLILYSSIILLVIGAVSFFFFQNYKFESSFSADTIDEVAVINQMPHYEAQGYQANTAIIPAETEVSADDFADTSYASILVDNTSNTILEAHNIYRRIYPASTTKLMTAILVAKAADEGKFTFDDMVTIDHSPNVTDPDAVASDIKVGDSISVRNLLYGMLIKSYNDYAVILAELVGGDVENFCQMMNEEAYSLGATGCHFVNPNGLHEDDHYVTAYDMYLIVREAANYDIIAQADSQRSYSYTYLDSDGNELSDDITPTNMFLSGTYTLPSNIEMTVWKTGTTRLAGNVLTMTADIDGKSYTMFVADSNSPQDLYQLYGRMFNMTN
ncbi:MAG: serine hydrolase [Lachnospiraceae bacterium]|nr:serine hydrolase [Lachnospiraceae bacterium]